MIRLHFLCVLSTIYIAQGGSSVNLCADIIPQSPVVELYTNLTAYCILNQTCLQQHNHKARSDELYWEVHSQRIPESQYTIINETVSSVTFEPTLAMGSALTCSIDLHGQIKTTLHGIFITLGLPPEKPRNLSCICYNLENLTCTWIPGRPTIIDTQYTVKQTWKVLDNSPALMQSNLTSYPAAMAKGRILSKYEYPKTRRPRRDHKPQKDCIAEGLNNYCTLTYPNFQHYIDTIFWVEAKNELGKAESDPIMLDVIQIVMTNPPKIIRVLSDAAALQKALKIEWTNPVTDKLLLKYNLRYRTSDSTEWDEVPSSDIDSTRTSYILQGLQPYTDYVISLRCKQMNDNGFWSKWSKEYTATTPESTPSQGPELWRKISDEDNEGKRAVRLMWKVLPSYANGIILTYNVTIKKATKAIDSFIVNGTSYDITVSRFPLQVWVTASNSYGTSPATTLIIAPTNLAAAQPAEIAVKAFPKDGKLWVEWSAPRTPVIGYAIEWCSNTEVMDCDIQWQREHFSTQGAFLRGDLQRFTYYLIQVHPLYNDGQDRPRYVGAYVEQKPPEVGPNVSSKTVEKTRAVLKWDPLPLEKRNGFIRNYTLKYSAANGAEESIILNATQTEYTLTKLLGKTMYSVSVTANNDKGGKEGIPSSFATHELDTGDIEAIVVSTCLGFLLFLLFGGLLYCKKREMIKKHIWPNVPDPSKSNIAQWSPHTPSRHDSKSHPFQDGSFTDVSVVEIADDEKKSYSEEDLKSVDLTKENTSEGLSSGIGGSSCMSSQRLSLSERDEVESAQNTSSNVQYSTVIISGYRGQQPTAAVPPMFSRSESTQPLLDSEERPDEVEVLKVSPSASPNQYFKQNCSQEDGGRPQTLSPEHPAIPVQEQLAQNQHLAGLNHEEDLRDCNAGQNVDSEGQPTILQMDLASDDMKSYLPQTARRGGYLPQ